MFVILAYDVNVKRGVKVMKTCRKYLRHTQKSVFEGIITESKLKQLEKELEQIIRTETDQICIYQINSIKYTSKIQIGNSEAANNIL